MPKGSYWCTAHMKVPFNVFVWLGTMPSPWALEEAMRRREFIGANKVQAADQPDDCENTRSKNSAIPTRPHR